MLSKEMTDMINSQINKELYSAYLYYAMASYFNEKAMTGFGHWFKKQAAEEIEHADKFVAYLEDHGARVTMMALEQPQVNFDNVEKALQTAYSHEMYVTASIKKIALLAKEEDDFLTAHFLGWFHAEQLEEEKSARDLLEEYQYIGDNKAAQRAMDKALALRE